MQFNLNVFIMFSVQAMWVVGQLMVMVDDGEMKKF